VSKNLRERIEGEQRLFKWVIRHSDWIGGRGLQPVDLTGVIRVLTLNHADNLAHQEQLNAAYRAGSVEYLSHCTAPSGIGSHNRGAMHHHEVDSSE
jgi:hypothetical protein